MAEKIFAILLAGGSGSRMGADRNKVLLEVAGVPCIVRSARALADFADHLVVVYHAGEEASLQSMLEEAALPVSFEMAEGGATRQQSVHHGLRTLAAVGAKPEDIVMIHDGARCMVTSETIQSVLASVRRYGSGIAAVPVTDTLRAADEHLRAGETVPRQGLWAMQTPQGARFGSLIAAFDRAEADHFEGTDDAAVLIHAGDPVHLAQGSRNNLKLTTREDLKMAEAMLKQDRDLCPFRIGQGYDVHQLVEGRKLILCGVEIPHDLGLLGHSDADVALHALMDALLGAAGLGDIGRHFPDSDPQYKGIDSMKLLAAVMEKLREAGYRSANVDVTIIAQRPKLASYIPRMAENLAQALHLPLSRINVKATTTEHLGFEGRMEGISAQAVCLIQPI